MFSGALRAGWIPLDDPFYVTRDPVVARGFSLSGAIGFLTRAHAHNWHPLTSWSHMLDVEWFGLDPGAHHGVSVAFHVVNALLLAIVLHRLTGAWWRSLLVAAFFAVHPLRVESVVWISERKDVLSALFFLLAIDLYRRWAAHPTPAGRALVVVAFALGLMAKPMIVTLPFVLVLLDIWPLGRLAGTTPHARRGAPQRSLFRLLIEKWPLLLLSAAASVVTFLVQRDTGAVVSTASLSLAARVANAVVSYWLYIGRTLWPGALAIFYPYEPTLAPALVIACAVGLAIVTLLTLRFARSQPHLAVGWLWFAGVLVPVIGIVQVGLQASADRYTYLATIGLAIMMVWGIAALVAGSRTARAAALAASAVALAALCVATTRYTALWQDPIRLFEHSLRVTRTNPIAHEGLGDALIDAGQIERAIPHLEAALRMHPGLPQVENNLGSALGSLGRYDEAAQHFRNAIEKGETAELRHNLAAALAGMGSIDEAIPEYEAAIRLDPASHASLAGLAAALLERGRGAEAAPMLRRAIQLAESAGDFDDAAAYRRLLGEN